MIDVPDQIELYGATDENDRDPRAVAEAAPLHLTYSLLANVQLLGDWLEAALADSYGTGPTFLSPTDPVGDLVRAAVKVSALNTELRAWGFDPREVDPAEDPIGFLKYNSEYLAKVAPYLIPELPARQAVH